MAEPSLYERLGGVFAIAAVVDHFSDALVTNAVAGETSENPQLRDWATNHLERLPGLKFMRTLWSATSRGDRSRTAPRSRAPRRSGWKRPIERSRSRRR